MILEGAESFCLRGKNSAGVLLVHGFTGLPAELFLLGEFLNREGFTVLGVRLAGHGTNEENLIQTKKEDWFNSVLDAYSILSGLCEKIFVVGHSMGGLLSFKLATIKKFDKLVSIATPIFIEKNFPLSELPPLEKCGTLGITNSRRKLKDVPSAVNLNYQQMPFVSVHELLKLIDEVKKILPNVKIPTLILHAEDDHTAQPESADFIAENIGAEEILKVKIHHGGHLLPLTESRETVFEEILKFIKKGY